MKAFAKLAVLIMAGVVSQSALAFGTEFSGKTTCYIFKNDKLVGKSNCSYKGELGGGMNGGGNDFTFKNTPTGKVTTSYSSWAKTNKQDERIHDSKGNDIWEKKATINKLPARMVFRDLNGFNQVDASTSTKLETEGYNGFESRGLSCIQAKNKSLEICTPLTSKNTLNGLE